MSNPHCRLLASFAAVLLIGAGLSQSVTPAAAQSAPNGFVNKGLVGVGRLPADMKDKFGETLGSGSGMAVDQIQQEIHSLPSHELPPLFLKPIDLDQLLQVLELQLSGQLPDLHSSSDTHDATI